MNKTILICVVALAACAGGPATQPTSRMISLCERARSASWAVIGGIDGASWPSRVVQMSGTPVEVTDVSVVTTEPLIGTAPRTAMLYGTVSSRGESGAGRLWDDHGAYVPALVFFRDVDGVPYFQSAFFPVPANEVFVFEGYSDPPERVARADMASTIHRYRTDLSTSCPTAPHMGGAGTDGGQ